MNIHPRLTAVALAACSLSACASVPESRSAPASGNAAFTIRTTPAGASVETSQGYRCTTPCDVPLGARAFVATVTLLGYKPVQLPVTAAQNPGPIDVKLLPQDPGAGAPNPIGGK